MSAPFRIIQTGVKKSNGISEDFKNYLSRLMKMIPGEVVGLYLIGSGLNW